LEGTYNKRVIAALIELGEFANEERFFKFWSNKGPSEKETRVEEYVDILHFLLSMLYSRGYRGENLSIVEVEGDWEEVWQNAAAEILGLSKLWEEGLFEPITSVEFGRVFSLYFRLGDLAGFEWEEVVKEYKRKNAVNFERLRSGY
ncbi:MAG: dUTP diphosphatase, partial [Clostridia bacterium]|nr:dUTP diphosphatase [Clostridia bacterium]